MNRSETVGEEAVFSPAPASDHVPEVAAVWSGLDTQEREVHRRAGYHRVFGLGRNPALLVIDVEYNFTGLPGQEPVESVEMYPNSCAQNAWTAIPSMAELIELCRQQGIPVIFTHGTGRDDPAEVPFRGADIVAEIAPGSNELVLAKSGASAFFASGLADHLRHLGVDTVIHLGGTTSGCVRASVVDAHDHGFRNAVVADGVFDRAVLPHQVNLFDMDAKYADVVSLAVAKDYIGWQGSDHA